MTGKNTRIYSFHVVYHVIVVSVQILEHHNFCIILFFVCTEFVVLKWNFYAFFSVYFKVNYYNKMVFYVKFNIYSLLKWNFQNINAEITGFYYTMYTYKLHGFRHKNNNNMHRKRYPYPAELHACKQISIIRLKMIYLRRV